MEPCKNLPTLYCCMLAHCYGYVFCCIQNTIYQGWRDLDRYCRIQCQAFVELFLKLGNSYIYTLYYWREFGELEGMILKDISSILCHLWIWEEIWISRTSTKRIRYQDCFFRLINICIRTYILNRLFEKDNFIPCVRYMVWNVFSKQSIKNI